MICQHPVKMQRRQLISAPTKQKRLNRGRNLQSQQLSFHLSGVKIFTVEAVSNSPNDRIYAHRAPKLADGSRTVFRRQHAAGVMVWAAVGSDGSKSPFISIEEGGKLNSVLYMKILEDKVLPWLNGSFGE